MAVLKDSENAGDYELADISAPPATNIAELNKALTLLKRFHRELMRDVTTHKLRTWVLFSLAATLKQEDEE